MNLIIYKRFLLIIFLLLAPTIGQSTGQEPVLSGIVKSKTGELIAGVAVRSYCGETKTDDHGQYFILPSSSNARCGLVRFLAEGPGYWPVLKRLMKESGVTGARIHDVRIAALCLAQGVRELWTADRDFSRFPSLRTRNALAG